MVRPALSPAERARGLALGRALRTARADRSAAEIALAAGVSTETLRKIETGRIPTPAFFTTAALAGAVGISLDDLAASVENLQPAAESLSA